MRLCHTTLILLMLMSPFAQADRCCPPPVPTDGCCVSKGGIHYCDSSAGRYVCGDGDYSTCYCTRHAVMDLQKLQGCCIWQGGVLKKDDETGLVICNDGGVSEICGLYKIAPGQSLW